MTSVHSESTVIIDGVYQSGGNNQINIGGGAEVIVGSGKKSSLNLPLAAFDKVESLLSANVVLTMGKKHELTIEGDDNIVPLVKASVKANKLMLSMEKSVQTELGLLVVVKTPSLSQYELSGAGNSQLEKIEASRLKLVLSGAGDLSANGMVGKLEAELNGSGDMVLSKLQSQRCQVSLDGSGDIYVNVKEFLSSNISGSGDVNVYGKPAKISSKVSGAGELLSY